MEVDLLFQLNRR